MRCVGRPEGVAVEVWQISPRRRPPLGEAEAVLAQRDTVVLLPQGSYVGEATLFRLDGVFDEQRLWYDMVLPGILGGRCDRRSEIAERVASFLYPVRSAGLAFQGAVSSVYSIHFRGFCLGRVGL